MSEVINSLVLSLGPNVKVSPGYVYGLGCSEWKANQHRGKVESWTFQPNVMW
jgi:hypothetical protein